MAFVSDSSGSAIPSFRAAVKVALRPITGPLIPALTPRSLSLSMVITSVRTIQEASVVRGNEAFPIMKNRPDCLLKPHLRCVLASLHYLIYDFHPDICVVVLLSDISMDDSSILGHIICPLPN